MSDDRQQPESLIVQPEAEPLAYEFTGPDADDKLERWALHDEDTYDAVHPAGD